MLEHRAHAHRIDADRLFQEAVLPCLDAGREVGRAKMRGRAIEDDVDVRGDQLLVRVEARVTPILRNLDALVLLQLGTRGLDAIGKDVGQGDELKVRTRVEEVDHRAAAATAAADQAGPKGLSVGGSGSAERLARERLRLGARGERHSCARDCSDGSEKITAVDGALHFLNSFKNPNCLRCRS